MTKSGPGALVLSGNNSYMGGTTIDSGIVKANSNTSLGDPSGAAAVNLATLEITNSFASNRSIKVANVLSTVQVDNAVNYTLNGLISNRATAGTLNKTGEALSS